MNDFKIKFRKRTLQPGHLERALAGATFVCAIMFFSTFAGEMFSSQLAGFDWDKVTLLLVELAVLILFTIYWRLESQPTFTTYAAAVVAVIFLYSFFFWQEPTDYIDGIYEDLWRGFNWFQIVLGISLAISTIFIINIQNNRTRLKFLFSFSFVLFYCFALYWRSPWSIELDFNNAFTFDELLAFSAGRIPGADYVSQYQNLLGLPLVIFRVIFPDFSNNPEIWVANYLGFLELLCLMVLILCITFVVPNRFRWTVPLLFLPIVALCGTAARLYYAALPLRFAGPVFLFTALVFIFRQNIRDKYPRIASKLVYLAAGIIVGFVVINNIDFGVPAVAAMFLTLLTIFRGKPKSILIGRWSSLFVGILISAFVWIVIEHSAGGHVIWQRLFFFITQFGANGFNNVTMPLWGFHLLLVFIGLFSAFFGWLNFSKVETDLRAPSLVFFGSWLIFGLPYYSGRSLLPVLVIYFLIIAPIMTILSTYAFEHFRVAKKLSLRLSLSKITFRFESGFFFFVLLFVGASWASIPDISHQYQRAISSFDYSHPTPKFMLPDPSKTYGLLKSEIQQVGYLGVSGNIWELKIGIKNLGLFASTDNLVFPNAIAMQCAYLKVQPERFILTTPQIASTLMSNSTCNSTFSVVQEQNLPDLNNQADWQVLRRR